MKIFNRITLAAVLTFVTGVTASHAQLKEELDKPSDYTGPVVKERSSQTGNLGNLFNMQMDHSYSMAFSSAGGQFQNINAYTNTMRFFFSDRLTGRLDLSLLHSPFGSSYINNNSQQGFGADIIIRNAELNYRLSDSSTIHVQFQQVPSYGLGYGMSPWSNYYHDPFGRRNFY